MLPGGLPASKLLDDVRRDHYADYLPWIAYDPETHRYLTQETALGYIWECSPLAFLSDGMADALEGIMSLAFTNKTVIQFILYADDHVAPFTEAFRANTRRDDPVLHAWAEGYARHLDEGASGLAKMGNIPTRRFRLFVTIKNGEKEDELDPDTIDGLVEFLKGANLHPRPLPPAELLSTMRGLFGAPAVDRYDDNIPIRKQVLRADDTISVEKNTMRLGSRYAKVLTPKLLPETIDVLKANQLFGGVFGASDDPDQIDSPFLYSLAILPGEMKTTLAAKAEVMNFQRSAGSFLSSLKRRLEEFDWALGVSDKTRFVRIIPSLTILAPNENKLRSAAARARRMWEGRGAVMQEESQIQQVVFLSSLPLGVYNTGNFVNWMDRYFVVPTDVVTRMLPIQADFSGVWPPRVAYVGRKGQLVALDVMSPLADNHNMLIAAGSGAGKSVATQHLLISHFRSGFKVRIIDIGYSYRKLTTVIGGRFIDLGNNFVLNPFDGIRDETDLEMAKAVVMQMCYSNQASLPDEIAYRLISEAVQWVHENRYHEDGVTMVKQYLERYAVDNADDATNGEIRKVATTLAFTLGDFAEDGSYANYFRGRSTLDIDNDDWIVLELEQLMGVPQLFNVVVLMLINKVTASLYLADAGKRVPTFILFDEAWKFLSESANGNQQVARVIEEGMRRARKYYGSFAVVTQSVRDTARFGAAGDVIRANTQFKVYLMSGDYQQAQDENLINYDPFALRLLKSVRTQRPRYSELFIDGGEAFGIGVARLVLDSFSYWLYTSDPADNRRIEERVAEGMTYAQAIKQLAEEDAR